MNKKNKILLIGANGQLGREFQNALSTGKTSLGKVDACFTGAELVCADYPQFDLTKKDQVQKLMEQKFDFVINCAAYTAVDRAEEDIENCFKINTSGVKFLAEECEKQGATLVHFSTDFVFKGDKTTPRCEYDFCEPDTIYGKTKLAGESYIQNTCKKYYIFRTSWLYGRFGKNFVFTMLNLAKTDKPLSVVNDQIGTPTSANELVYVVLKTILTEDYGLYHSTGEGQCSWCEFAREIFKMSGVSKEVHPVTSDEYPQKAKRPHYSVLENLHLKTVGTNFFSDWKVALKNFLNEVAENEKA